MLSSFEPPRPARASLETGHWPSSSFVKERAFLRSGRQPEEPRLKNVLALAPWSTYRINSVDKPISVFLFHTDAAPQVLSGIELNPFEQEGAELL